MAVGVIRLLLLEKTIDFSCNCHWAYRSAKNARGGRDHFVGYTLETH